MKLLSIDVGIKNLSFCLFEYDQTNKIIQSLVKWDNINLTQKDNLECIEIDKNGLCGKPSKFIKNDKCYCLKHSKKQEYLHPINELTNASLNKLKVTDIQTLMVKYNIDYEKSMKLTKTQLVEKCNQFVEEKCFSLIKKNNASKTNLVTIGKNIQYKFDETFGDQKIDLIIIENQIGPLANKMKTIQGMLAQYFIMKNADIEIEFVSAINKLKKYLTEKIDYKERKKLGVKVCSEFVSNDNKFKEWEHFFQKHTKKDDLSDCFLQGMWYIDHFFEKTI
jgi:hypothetical protein